MSNSLGISQDGLKAALDIKEHYKNREPLLVPGELDRILAPETLLMTGVDLHSYDDPMPLAMMAVRDPEGPMALAAAARLSPHGPKTKLTHGILRVAAENSKHDLVKACLTYINDHAFDPDSIAKVRRHTSKIIVETRQQYTAALRQNLRALMEGDIAPRHFVREFFQLTEAGNMRHEIRKKLVLSLLSSPNVRPSIKFMMLENFQRMPKPVRLGIVEGVMKAEPSRHIDVIKEELRYIITQEALARNTPETTGEAAARIGAKLPEFPNPAPRH